MILSEEIKVRCNSKNFKHFNELGYDVKINEYFQVKIKDLSKNSHTKIFVKCDICGDIKNITYFSYCRNINNGNLYTCYKCSKIKSKKTSLDKYGVEYPIQLENIKQKREKNNIEKYGVDYPSKLKENIDKCKKTKLEKYGNENYVNIEKAKETKLEKYGNENYVNIEKIKKTNLEKYGCENVFQNNEIKNKKIKTFIKNYGVDNYSKSEIYKNKKNKFILDKYENINILESNNDIITFICDCEKDHLYDININVLRNRIIYKTILCTVCNPVNSYTNSGHEIQLQNFIKENYKDDIILNNRDLIGKELDIYLPKIKIAFEFNGLYWHCELNKEKNYHLNKTETCENLGIKLIHIYEDEWVNDEDKIKTKILNILKNNKPSSIEELEFIDIYKIKKLKNEILCEVDRSWSNGSELEELDFKLIEKIKPEYRFIDKENKIKIWNSGYLKYIKYI